jgi:G:T-mismatch repair DNA endonuclease (very short patch repair protein)
MARDAAATSRNTRISNRQSKKLESVLNEFPYRIGMRYQATSKDICGTPAVSTAMHGFPLFLDEDSRYRNERICRQLLKPKRTLPSNTGFRYSKFPGYLQRTGQIGQELSQEKWTELSIWNSSALQSQNEEAESVFMPGEKQNTLGNPMLLCLERIS